jgi:MFS family permease
MTSDHPSPATRPSDGLWAPHRRTLTLGLVLTITLVAFEALAISTVMPQVARELGALENGLYGWAFTAFFLGSLVGIVVVGGAVDSRGLATPFLVGLGLFAVGLLLGGLAPTMPVLIAGRLLQGLGAGAIPPIAYVAIARSLPESLRPRMFALLSTAWVLPGVIGPAIAGIVGEHFGWRAVFLGLLPLIGLAGIVTLPAVRSVTAAPESVEAEASASASLRRRIPLALIVAVGAGLVTAAMTSGEPILLATLVLPGLILGLAALRRLTPRGTLVAARGMPAAILLRGFATFAFFGVDAYVSLALTERGLSLSQAGIALTAATISWTAGSWIQAQGSDRWPPGRFVRVGLLVVAGGIAAFAVVLAPAVSIWFAVPTFAIVGLGMGLSYAPLSLIVLREAPVGEQGSASSALSLSDVLGTALGTGLTGAIVAAGLRAGVDTLTGLVIGFVAAGTVALCGFFLSTRLRPVADGRALALR